MAGPDLDLLFCNEAEALDLSGTDSLTAAVDALKSIARRFSITLGAKGALLYDGDELIEIAPHQVEAVDTNGAGDIYAGSFLYGITNGMSFTQAGELASLTSSRLVTQFGPRLPRETLQQLLTEYSA
jgi:sugar/nucleoside kinase (ribokinase family)